ncbi:hypothetical protein ES705_10086 [subsurface metagenome]
MNFKKLKKIIPKEIALIGNLDPVKIFLQSTPNEVAEATRSYIQGTHPIFLDNYYFTFKLNK